LKAWPVSLTLVVAPFLFGALGVAINPKNKETKEAVQASATLAVQQKGVGTPNTTPAQESPVRTVAASMTPIPSPVEQPTATPTPVGTPKPTATPKALTTPSPTPKPEPLRRINKDVLGAYSKEDFTEMMDMYAIQNTDGVKQMVSEGKVVGLRKGVLVYLEDVDVRDRIVKVRPKGSTTAIWIPSQFLD
jgi:cell division septation protein DedD